VPGLWIWPAKQTTATFYHLFSIWKTNIINRIQSSTGKYERKMGHPMKALHFSWRKRSPQAGSKFGGGEDGKRMQA
jgi:hypothetical protein